MKPRLDTTMQKGSVEQELDEMIVLANTMKRQVLEIRRAGQILCDVVSRNGCIYWCGNGGSAAESSHLAAELVGRYEQERRPISSHALTVDTSAMTAIANDYGFEEAFARQIQACGRREDALVALSTSGMSQNVIRCVEEARHIGLKTIGLVGCDGGRLAEKVDVIIRVESGRTSRIQEMHLIVGHILCGIIERSSADITEER